MTRRALGASVGTAVAAGLALAATAPAAVYCVHQTGACGPGEIDQGANLQAALTAADGSLEDDQVKVRAEATPYSGPFTYAGAGGAVQITGGGSGTILTAPMANGVTVLKVAGAASRVESLHIDVPLGNTTNLNTGLELAGTADGMSVLVPESPTGDTFGVQLTGGTFRNGSVLGPMPAAPLAFDLTAFSGSGTVLIEDSTVRMDEATDLFGGGTIRRVDAQGRIGFGLQAENLGGADGTFLIEDSLWRTQPGATGTFQLGLFPACGTTSDLQVTARNLTLVNGTSEGSTASSICNVNARTASVSLASSIVLGGAASLRATTAAGATSAVLNVSHSDYDPVTVAQLGNGSVVQGPGNVNVSPGFAGATDFRLLETSPLIDIGDPSGLAVGESPTDLDGAARIVNGGAVCSARRDIGAYEAPAQPAPASCQPAAPASCRGKPATVGAARAVTSGTEGNDTLSGTSGPDVIDGGGGNDSIRGLGGKDVICGDGGKDKLIGGAGKDTLDGGAGKDRLKGGRGRDTCVGGKGRDKTTACERGKP